MQHERRVTRDCLKPVLSSDWAELGGLVGREIGDVDAGPFALGLVPPNQFLAVAPRRAGRAGARSIIYDAAVARPGEAPPVAKVIRRFPRKSLVDFVRAEDAGVNPAAACRRTVGLQPWIAVNLRTVMQIAFAIDTEHDSVCGGLRSGVPAVDLCQYRLHFWIAQLVFVVPPVKRAQRIIERIVGLF